MTINNAPFVNTQGEFILSLYLCVSTTHVQLYAMYEYHTYYLYTYTKCRRKSFHTFVINAIYELVWMAYDRASKNVSPLLPHRELNSSNRDKLNSTISYFIRRRGGKEG